MNVHKGSCLCGTVRYEVQGDFNGFYLCHCTYCQKDTGSAHAANLFGQGAQLSWLSGETDVTRFTLAGTRHSRSFCKHCGSAMPGVLFGGAAVLVPAGSLDTLVPVKPTAHVFTASKAGWEDDMASAPAFEQMPPR